MPSESPRITLAVLSQQLAHLCEELRAMREETRQMRAEMQDVLKAHDERLRLERQARYYSLRGDR